MRIHTMSMSSTTEIRVDLNGYVIPSLSEWVPSRVDSRIRHLHIEHLRRASPEESSSTVDVSSTDNIRVEKPRPSLIVSSPPTSTSFILDPVTDPVSSLPQAPDPSPICRSTRSTRGQAPEKLNL